MARWLSSTILSAILHSLVSQLAYAEVPASLMVIRPLDELGHVAASAIDRLAQASPQVPPLPPGSQRKRPKPSLAGEVCLNKIPQLHDGHICVSSVLKPQSDYNYGPQNLFDDNPATAWVEGVAGHGEGQMVVIEFDQEITVSKIEVMNGYNKNASIFRKNGPVADIRVTTSQDEQYEFHLSDKEGWQSLNGPVKPVRWIALNIVSVYPGEKYEDTALSELMLR
jgi:hypothetical protein